MVILAGCCFHYKISQSNTSLKFSSQRNFQQQSLRNNCTSHFYTMLKHLLLGSSLLIAIVSLLLSQWTTRPSTQYTPSVVGRNNTVLFIVNSEFGLSNVHLATAQGLLERHPEVEIHVASFAPTYPRIERISKHGRKMNSSSQDIIFHELPAQHLFARAMAMTGRTATSIIHPPGRAHIDKIGKDLAFYVAPWSGEAHLALYQNLAGNAFAFSAWGS